LGTGKVFVLRFNYGRNVLGWARWAKLLSSSIVALPAGTIWVGSDRIFSLKTGTDPVPDTWCFIYLTRDVGHNLRIN